MREEHRKERLQRVRIEKLEADGAPESRHAALEAREKAAPNERTPQ